MKEYKCIKDFYLYDTKFASENDIVQLHPDGTFTNGESKVFNMPGVVNNGEYFVELENDDSCDNVNKPSHYTSGNIECIDAMISAYGKEDVKAFCKCNAFKYQWRFDKKNGTEDLKKAQWYQNKYIELCQK